MKKAKIVLILSVLIFVALLVVFIMSKSNKDEKNTVSKREQYQQELLNQNSEEK